MAPRQPLCRPISTAHPRRSAAHRREHRQAAGASAPAKFNNSLENPFNGEFGRDLSWTPATRGRMADIEKKTKRHSRKLDRARVLTSMYVAR